MTESFDDALVTVHKYRLLSGKMCNRLQRAHDHEMEQLRRLRFREGYEAGQRSMDAEHYAVALRLKHLPLDEDSHGNLSQIARAVWHGDFGWTKGACEALRDELIELLGGVHDEPAPIPASGCACDADCDCSHGDETAVSKPLPNFSELFQNFSRTFAEPNLPKSAEIVKPESDDGGENCRITDELREWMDLVLTADDQAWDIADRIDEQLKRICWQQEAVLQHTIDTMVDERDKLRTMLTEQRDEARAKVLKLDNEVSDLLDLLRDARDEYKMLDQASSETSANFHAMRDRVWVAEAERDELRKSLREIAERVGVPHDIDLDEYSDDFVVKATLAQIDSTRKYVGALEWQRDRQKKMLEELESADTPEDIVRDIHLGKVTDTQAIERIRALL